jgi:Leucine-rich repeat (LRR) protein
MLDLSNNQLKEIPSNINELINLSVLNISGNKGKHYNFKIKY